MKIFRADDGGDLNSRWRCIMTDKTRDFDSEARFWDENPGRVKMARSVADAIMKNVSISGEMDVLDFGCGTGLLTLQFQPLVKQITGADSSQGMLDILASKIENLGFNNVGLIHLEEGDTSRLTGPYDIVMSSMTLHHVKNTGALISKFSGIVKPGGCLCLADLDPDNGLFHEDNTGVFHNGFEREKLKAEIASAGFTDIKDVTAAEVVKPGADGVERKFSVFMITGSKE